MDLSQNNVDKDLHPNAGSDVDDKLTTIIKNQVEENCEPFYEKQNGLPEEFVESLSSAGTKENADCTFDLNSLDETAHINNCTNASAFHDNESDSHLTKPPKVHSQENILRNEGESDRVTESGSFAIQNVASRRNSLPEIYLLQNSSGDLLENTDKDLDSLSINEITSDFRSDDISRLNLAKNKKQIDRKNISGVVKNVHGLFSMVKSACKPMEKNLSDMVLATQRNLAMAKHDYLRGDKSKHTMQKNNPEEENIFKKCDNFPNVESDSMNEKIEHQSAMPFGELVKTEENQSIGSGSCSTISSEKILEFDNVVSTANNDLNQPVISKLGGEDDKSDNMSLKSNDVSNSETLSNRLEPFGELRDKNSAMESQIMELRAELSSLKMALIEKDAIKKNLESKLNLFMKQLETVTAERDASVVRYAMSERSALEAIKAKEAALASEQQAKRESSMITQRLRIANADKTRASSALDMKCHELSLSQREVSKLKDELQSADVKLKWAQSKLHSEMETHKETSALVEKLTVQLKQMGGDSVCPSLLMPQSEIDSQLREKDATIILEKHEREKFETKSKQLQAEVDQLKSSLSSASNEIKELKTQVESGTAESAALRRTCSELRDQGAKDCERLAAAQARAARCDTLATHLQQEQDRSAKLVGELEAMRVLREDALAEGELRIRREAELLRQAERLTAAGVKLQGQCSEAEAKALALTVENAALREAANRATAEVAQARAELVNEREGRAADARALASRAAQHARGEREALAALEASKGELRVLSTKHASALKEMKREMLQLKRKYERYESEGKLIQIPDKVFSDKTGSTSSLSSSEGYHQHSDASVNEENSLPSQTSDNQKLVERIVNLQRAAAKRSEKLEFVEEHNRQLTQELQRKTRVLRSLLMSLPSGKLTSPASDVAKAEIGRHGGVMASVYGSQVADETMTLELSLEINAKLQSLLEDTLLSNMTLKENMDTLGDEITRLKDSHKVSKNQ